MVDGPTPARSQRRPDFLVIGAMKCATSTLHVQLGLQPGIFTTEPKEPGYFSDDDVYARGPGWYAGLFEPAAAGDLCGESSTHYTKLPTYPRTVERMRRDLGEVRLVYLMRDPLERIVSQYIHEWTQHNISGSLDEALGRRPELVDYSRYAMQLEPYLEAFGRESLLLVFLERLRAKPQAELERICRFLGYPGTPRWDAEQERMNVSRERMRGSPLRVFLERIPGLRTLHQRVIKGRFRDRLKDLWRIAERPEIGEARLREIEAVLDEDLARLGSWLGTDLACRDFGKTVSERSLEWTRTGARP